MTKRYIKLSLAAVIWLLIIAPDIFGVSIEYVNSTLWGQINDIVISGDYAYCSFVNGLGIFDISDKTNPKFISKLFLYGYGEGLKIRGEYAYFCDGGSGLSVISIADINNPRLLSSCDLPEHSHFLFLVGDYAYFEYDGIHVADITDPLKPVKVITLPVLEPKTPSYSAKNSYKLIPYGTFGLLLLDVTNPGNPFIAATIHTHLYANYVYRFDSLLYVSESNSKDSCGLEIIDITNPLNPISKCYIKSRGGALALSPNLEYAYLAETVYGGFSHLAVFNLKDSSNATRYEVPDTISIIYRAVVSQGYLYLAGSEYEYGGLYIYNIDDPSRPKMIGKHLTSKISDIYSTIDRCYVADGYYGGFKIVEIDSLNNMNTIGSYYAPNGSDAVAVKGDYAFITSYPGMTVLDMKDPTNLTPIGKYDFYNTCDRLFIDSNRVYLADAMSMDILDIQNPANPALVYKFDPPKDDSLHMFFDVVVHGNHIYIADGFSGLFILDNNTKDIPALVSKYSESGGYYKVAIKDSSAFLIDGELGVVILDIQDPNKPVLLSTYNHIFRPTDLFVSNNYLFITSGGGLQLLDISDLHRPTQIAEFSTNLQATRVNVVGDKIYVASEAALFLLKLVP